MSHLPHSIELHDSLLAEIEQQPGFAVLRLRPAYVHRNGKGWRQDADIVVGSANIEGEPPELPARLADGRLKTTLGPYHNLLELPLNAPGEVLLTLEFFSEEVFHVRGASVKVVLHGEAQYVEDFV